MAANLLLHVESNRVEREALTKVPTPPPTATWHPIPHHELLEGVAGTLERSGLRIVNEALGLSQDGNRFFGLLEIGNGHHSEEYALIVGIRNSHDKTFPVGLVCGSHVLVCDNLSFSGEVNIVRRHTRFVSRDLPQLIETAVGRLGDLRRTQEDRFAYYKGFKVTDPMAHDMIINAMDARIIGATRIPGILRHWRNPDSPFRDRNAWSLFNSFTQVLRGLNLNEVSRRSQALHGLFDSYTGRVSGEEPRVIDAEFREDEP